MVLSFPLLFMAPSGIPPEMSDDGRCLKAYALSVATAVCESALQGASL